MKAVTLNLYCGRCAYRWDSHPTKSAKCPICNNPAREGKKRIVIDQQAIVQGVSDEHLHPNH